MKQTKEDLILETAFAVEDCIESDGNEVTGVDTAGIRAVLSAFAHRLGSGETGIEDAVIQKVRDNSSDNQKAPALEHADLTNREWMMQAQKEAIQIALQLEKALQS